MRLNKLGLVAGSALAMTWSVLATAPAHAVVNDTAPASPTCLIPAAHGPAVAARGGHTGEDTRPMSAEEQRAVRNDMKARLQQQGLTLAQAAQTTAEVPVYVHVMRDAQGNGDVTDRQITQQIAELNQDFAGGESSAAANLGFTFRLAGVDRYDNNQWHQDKQSNVLPQADQAGGRQRAQHLDRGLQVPRDRHLPLGLRQAARHRRHPGPVLLTAGRFCSPTSTWARPRRTRRATGSGSTTPSRAAVPTSPSDEVRRHPRAGEPDVRLPRGPGLLPARPGWTRSTTTWTTATTPATTSSRPGQSARASQMWAAYRA